MTTPETPTAPHLPTLESVLRDAWAAFQPHQPAPLGWLTHTTTQIQAYLDDHPTPPSPPSDGDTDSVTRWRRAMWQALREAAATHDIDVDAANRLLRAVDLPPLPRRWQVRLTLPVLIEVTASSREDAFDTAETAIETALTNADLQVRFEWDGSERDDADPGDLDTAADEPAELG
ncbi:hypothetical protein U2F26_31880 [Micromonospora sp. 4G57]|uniref:Uncharacterized protein n=1 Tax=Micromonospora sicca TaxID=2202420 RepID=A0ABU5JN55_9ACTN|nr:MULTISPECIES: hypothetical protein [unclassified Micromonospora]MDZ5447256.1 hypothetical protein [Micromonospora sp. 4G57]MDZ5493952.1 hypothetical protein [Micromonospora sp. 4G53]